MKKETLAVNAISNWIALAVTTVISLVLTPYLVSKIGSTDYGLWKILLSVIGMYGLLDLGITSAINRYAAYYLGKGDQRNLNSVYSTALAFFGAIGLLCVAISFIFWKPLAHVFKTPEELLDSFRITILIFGASVAITFITSVQVCMLHAYMKFIPTNIVKIINELLRGGLSILFIELGMGIWGLAYATLICSVVTLVLNTLFSRRYAPALKLKVGLIEFGTLMTLVSFGIPAMLTVIAAYLRTGMDNFVVGGFISLSAVTIYGFGSMFCTFLVQVIVSLSGVLDPRFAQLVGQGDTEKIRGLHKSATAYISALSFTLGFALIWVGKALLKAWVGEIDGYLDAYPILVVLTIGQMLSCCHMPSISLIFAANKHRILSLIVVAEGGLNLVLSIAFAKLFGMIGVAIGTLIPTTLRFFVDFLYLKRATPIRMKDVISAIARPLVVVSIPSIAMILFAQPEDFGWAGVFAWGGLFVAVILIIVNFVGLPAGCRIKPSAYLSFFKGERREEA